MASATADVFGISRRYPRISSRERDLLKKWIASASSRSLVHALADPELERKLVSLRATDRELAAQLKRQAWRVSAAAITCIVAMLILILASS